MKNGQYYSQAKTHNQLRESGMEYVNCPICNGTGTVITPKIAGNCSACYGDGKVWQSAKDDWFCDCTESAIKRVDAKHPHPAIERDGWFCMGCLQEFKPVQDQP